MASYGLHPNLCTTPALTMIPPGWNALLGAVRTQTSLTTDILELCICRTMLVTGAWHEWENHVSKLLAVEGFTEEHMSVVKQGHLKEQSPLSDRQWAALLYTEHMTRAVSVPNSVFNKVTAAGFSPKEVVEMTTLIGAYNMVGRVFVALDVAEANEKVPQFLEV